MVKNLTKGMKLKFEKDGDQLTKVRAVIEYNKQKYTDQKRKFDADISAAVLSPTSRNPSMREVFAGDEDYLSYYGAETDVPLKDANGQPVLNSETGEPVMVKSTPKGEVIHYGDDVGTGQGREIIDFHLDLMHPEVIEIPIIGTIHKGSQRDQNWHDLEAVLTLIDLETGDEIARYELGEKFPKDTAVQFGSLYPGEDGWEFSAMGVGSNHTLQEYLEQWI